jgi:hypothetical protein
MWRCQSMRRVKQTRHWEDGDRTLQGGRQANPGVWSNGDVAHRCTYVFSDQCVQAVGPLFLHSAAQASTCTSLAGGVSSAVRCVEDVSWQGTPGKKGRPRAVMIVRAAQYDRHTHPIPDRIKHALSEPRRSTQGQHGGMGTPQYGYRCDVEIQKGASREADTFQHDILLFVRIRCREAYLVSDCQSGAVQPRTPEVTCSDARLLVCG